MRPLSICAALVFLPLVACDGTTDQPSGQAGVSPTAEAPSTANTTDVGRLQISLSDPQIVQVMASYNVTEAMVADAALPDLTRSDVEAFDMHVASDHRAANNSVDTLRDAVPLTAKWSTLSQMVEHDGDLAVADLSKAGDVDMGYVGAELIASTQALTLIDCVLLAEVQEPALKTLIRDNLRPQIASHRAQAEWFVDPQNTRVSPLQSCERLCAPRANGGALSDPVRNSVCGPQSAEF
jgi:predicted outer membrane protein